MSKPSPNSSSSESSPSPALGAALEAVSTMSGSTRRTQLLKLLQQPGGMSLAQIAETFGWQPHTARAALSGLRKAGHPVVRSIGPDGQAVYRIALVEG